MALQNYVDVQERINRFWQDFPEGAIRTRLESDPHDFTVCRYRAEVYKQRDAHAPDATGYAFEVKQDSGKGANVTSHEENCETSAIGRALANMGYAKDGKSRPSRQEMSKVERVAETPQEPPHAPKPANAGTDTSTPKDMRAEALGRTLHGLLEHDFLHAIAVQWNFASFANVPADRRQNLLDYLNGKGDPTALGAFTGFLTKWEQDNKRSARKAPQQSGWNPSLAEVPNPARQTN